jgi:selenocysteine lyase/cysteine desulfurase
MNDIPNSVNEALEQSISAALETYSNVHRGSGHFSVATTRLYEKAREVVLEYLGLDKRKFTVVFCSPREASKLTSFLKNGTYRELSGTDAGLHLGVRAVAVKKRALPSAVPFLTGGGTARLIGPDWIVRAKLPQRFEPGTPAILNVIAYARALQLNRKPAPVVFPEEQSDNATATAVVYGKEPDNISGEVLLEKLKQQVLGSRVLIPAGKISRRFVNFDYAASTPALKPVWEAFTEAFRLPDPLRQKIVVEVQKVCARFLNAPLSDYEVIFTRNTTEALNLVAESFSREQDSGMEPVVLNSLLEHNSNELPWRAHSGLTRVSLWVDEEGFFDLQEMERLLKEYNELQLHGKKRIRLVAVCGASNVMGTFNDLEETGRLAHRYGANLLVDGAQLVAHRKVDMKKCGIDYLAFSGHKVYAPFGAGVLVVRKGLLSFGPEELDSIRSSGEENTGGIAALGRVLTLLQQTGMDIIQKEEQLLTAHLLREMVKIPGLTVYGIKDPQSPSFARKGSVVAFSIRGMMPDRIAAILAGQEGIGIRTGCHCAHLLVKHMLRVPPSLQKLQRVIVTLFPKIELPGVARISIGIGNTAEDADALIRALHKIAEQKKASGMRSKLSDREEHRILMNREIRKKLEEFAAKAESRVFPRT